MILDCFTFFNELDLLEVRLHTLAPWVDAFILSEGNRTFQGAEKPFVFREHKNEARFNCGKPIIHVGTDLSGVPDNPWWRECVQRWGIKYGLESSDYLAKLHSTRSDRIILSDVDEIPDLRVFDQLAPDSPTVIAWHQNLYYYWVNMRCWDWIGPVSCTLETFLDSYRGDMQLLRDSRLKAEMIIDGGWHFSFLGGPEAIKEKIKAFSHTEYRECAGDGNIEYALKHGWKDNVDVFDRRMMHFEVIADDTLLPEYLQRNKDRFREWWYKSA